jgi:hypothetical protein
MKQKMRDLLSDNWTNFTFDMFIKKKDYQIKLSNIDIIHKQEIKLAENGEIGKAYDKLMQDKRKIIPNNDVFEQLQSKHPNPGDSELDTQTIDSLYNFFIDSDPNFNHITADEAGIETICNKAKKFSASGIDKLRYEHLKTLFCSCDIPEDVNPFFTDIEIIALPKNENDIRPIALQPIYRKLAGKICLLATKQINETLFNDLQFGTAKLGMEKIIHTFRHIHLMKTPN